jgi:hypothetical protein
MSVRAVAEWTTQDFENPYLIAAGLRSPDLDFGAGDVVAGADAFP